MFLPVVQMARRRRARARRRRHHAAATAQRALQSALERAAHRLVHAQLSLFEVHMELYAESDCIRYGCRGLLAEAQHLRVPADMVAETTAAAKRRLVNWMHGC